MPFYHVRFDNIGYTTDAAGTEESLSDDAAAELTRQFTARGDFPDKVLEIVEANVSEDEGQPQDGEFKVFISILLKIEADNLRRAENVEITPHFGKFLDTVAQEFSAINPDEEWEVLEVGAIEETPELDVNETSDTGGRKTPKRKMGT